MEVYLNYFNEHSYIENIDAQIMNNSIFKDQGLQLNHVIQIKEYVKFIHRNLNSQIDYISNKLMMKEE